MYSIYIDRYNIEWYFAGHGGIGGPAGISTVDMERTLKSLNGYHEVEVQYFSLF